MNNKDLGLAAVIGGAVGLLIQPVLLNTRALEYFSGYLPWSVGVLRVVVFVLFLVLAPAALFVAGYIGRRIPVVYQFGKFAAVGSLNAFLDLGVFNLQTLFSGIPAAQLSNLLFGVFKTVSFLVATTNSYLWNKNWTFGDHTKTVASTVAKFYGLTALTWALNVSVATGVKAVGPGFGLDAAVWVNVVAPLAGVLSAFAGNFLGYKFVVFKNNH